MGVRNLLLLLLLLALSCPEALAEDENSPFCVSAKSEVERTTNSDDWGQWTVAELRKLIAAVDDTESQCKGDEAEAQSEKLARFFAYQRESAEAMLAATVDRSWKFLAISFMCLFAFAVLCLFGVVALLFKRRDSYKVREEDK